MNGILNPEERAWLRSHPDVTFAPDPKFPPIEYFDSNGNYTGLTADYFKIIEKNLGYKFKIAKLNSWNEVLEQAKAGKIDGITAAQITPDRLEFLTYSSPILDVPNVIITQKNWIDPLALKDMEGWTIAITRGYAIEEYIQKNYPYITIREVDNDQQALEWVSFDRADATVVNLAIASYLINEHGITNLRVAGDSGRSNPLSIAVRSDEPILLSIMEKGLGSISDQQRSAIYSRWIDLENTGSAFPNQLLIFTFWGLAALAVIIFISIFWNMTLQTQVNAKTSALNRELTDRIRAEEKMNQQLANISALRAVGIAINASMDLQLTLNILLDQVSSKLKVDACNVLLLQSVYTNVGLCCRPGIPYAFYPGNKPDYG